MSERHLKLVQSGLKRQKCLRCEQWFGVINFRFESDDSEKLKVHCIYCEAIMKHDPIAKSEFASRMEKVGERETWKFNSGKPDSEKHKNTAGVEARNRRCPATRMLNSTRSGAVKRGHEHTITKQDIKDVFVEKCPYLGIELDYAQSARGQVPYNAATVDRIDNSVGYLPDNIQIISHLANKAKQDMSLEELRTFASNVIKIHGLPYEEEFGDGFYPE